MENVDKIKAEIEDAVTKSAEQDDNKTEDATTASDVAEATPEAVPAEPSSFEADEATLERAIRAGMSLKQAKALGDELPAMIEKLEAHPEKTSVGDEAQPAEEVAPLELPDLPSDDDYDPAIRKVLEAYKGEILKLREELGKVRTAGESAKAESWFDKQFAALGDTSASREDLQRKFRILTAGYKAEGVDIAPEEVFKEAASSFAEAKPGKAEKLAQRSKLAVARPGRDTSVHAEGDKLSVEDRIAARLNQKIAAFGG